MRGGFWFDLEWYENKCRLTLVHFKHDTVKAGAKEVMLHLVTVINDRGDEPTKWVIIYQPIDK